MEAIHFRRGIFVATCLETQSTPQKLESSWKSLAKECLIDSDVRRRNRLKIRNKGFKQSAYGKSNCLGCSNKPPTITNSVIRDLGKELCQIDPDDDNLMKEREVGTVGAKKKDVKTPKSKKNNDISKNKKDED
jgi:hypothetical protein